MPYAIKATPSLAKRLGTTTKIWVGTDPTGIYFPLKDRRVFATRAEADKQRLPGEIVVEVEI